MFSFVRPELKQGVASGQDRPPRDVSMTLHHIATATLCLQVTFTHSLCDGYYYHGILTIVHVHSLIHAFLLSIPPFSILILSHILTQPHINPLIFPIYSTMLSKQSYALGYVKIGSVIMFLHDISDIPLDLVRLFGVLQVSDPLLPQCS